MKTYDELKALTISLEKDVEKFEAGNSAAGTRVREGLQEAKLLAQQLRLEIQETKKRREQA